MDELRKHKILEIVKKMNLDRVPISEIRTNLRNMGVTPYDIDDVVREVNLQPTPSEIHSSVLDIRKKIEAGGYMEPAMKQLEDHRKIAERMEEKLQAMHGDVSENKDSLEDLAKSLEEHREKLEDINTNLQDLTDKHQEVHEKIDEMGIKGELDEIKDSLLELKSLIAALKDLNERILRTNQENLMRRRE